MYKVSTCTIPVISYASYSKSSLGQGCDAENMLCKRIHNCSIPKLVERLAILFPFLYHPCNVLHPFSVFLVQSDRCKNQIGGEIDLFRLLFLINGREMKRQVSLAPNWILAFEVAYGLLAAFASHRVNKSRD